MVPIRGLILDLGGVVLSWAPEANLDLTWERRLGLPSGEIARRVWLRPELRAAELGQITTAEFWAFVRSALGLTETDAAEMYEHAWSVTEVMPAVKEWLSSLRPQYVLASLSNGWSNDRREVAARYGIDGLFDLMVFSAEEGVAKPDPSAYHLTLDRLGLLPEEVLFVDDRQANIDGARAVGLQVLLCTGPDQLVADCSARLAGGRSA